MQSIECEGKWNGVFVGIRFFDRNGAPILEAGKINERDDAFYIEDFKIRDDERLVGIKSCMNEKGTARHWNLQFTIGCK